LTYISWTYKSVLVGNVVSQLEFVKIDDFRHPLFTSSRTVRVNVHPLWHFGVGLPCHHPAGVMKFISAVVGRNNVHQENIFGLFVQTSAPHFERGEHSPVTKENKWWVSNRNMVKLFNGIKKSAVIFFISIGYIIFSLKSMENYKIIADFL